MKLKIIVGAVLLAGSTALFAHTLPQEAMGNMSMDNGSVDDGALDPSANGTDAPGL